MEQERSREMDPHRGPAARGVTVNKLKGQGRVGKGLSGRDSYLTISSWPVRPSKEKKVKRLGGGESIIAVSKP